MATYYHGGSEIQADHGLQTLYLMNPNYVAYSDTPQQPAANMILLNSAGHALNPTNIPHAPPQQVQHFVGIPLSASASTVGSSNSDDSSRQSMHGQLDHTPSNIHAGGSVPYFHYNLWGSVNQPATTNLTGNYPHIPPMSTTGANSGVATDVSSQLGFRRPTPMVSSATQQGLSLSLSPQRPPYRASVSGDREIQAHSQVRTTVSLTSGDNMRICGGSSSSASALSTGISGLQNVSLDCKYLKAAQELLDEVVYVGKGIKTENIKEMRRMNKEETTGVIMDGSSAGDSSTKRGAELTTAQRQELQMKKANLVNMLDEVEQRYRQYHQQVQIVVSAFEQVAGFGAAKSYTALSLQRISKQFRCLKDAISAQIKATSKSLGEDQECVDRGKAEGSSRLKFVDDQLRQQRALQQLGMIQQNAWRPQRGLPERAVSVLRAWLFEHFLHPYPKDSDKHMLAKQTGLTRSQVSNWFINARVRLWKPMVEEMYQEEIKDQEQNGPIDSITKHEENKNSGLKPTAQIGIEQLNGLGSKKERCSNQKPSPSEISQSTAGSLQAQAAGFSLIGSPKKPRSSNDMQNSPSSILSMDMDHMKPGDQTSREINTKLESNQPHSRNGYSLITGLPASNEGGFGAYPNIVEIGRFNSQQLAPRFHGNGVSLTLGLPHCENLSQQSYLSGEADFCGINTSQPASHSTTGYENIGIQNRKRFAAQLLPDFVT